MVDGVFFFFNHLITHGNRIGLAIRWKFAVLGCFQGEQVTQFGGFATFMSSLFLSHHLKQRDPSATPFGVWGEVECAILLVVSWP